MITITIEGIDREAQFVERVTRRPMSVGERAILRKALDKAYEAAKQWIGEENV